MTDYAFSRVDRTSSRRQRLRRYASVSALASGLLAVGLASPASAQDRVYTGPGTVWNTGANWNGSDAPDTTGETAVFQNNGAPSSVSVTADVGIDGMRFEAAAPSRTVNVGALLGIYGAGISNQSGNLQTINIDGANIGTTSLQMAGSSDFTDGRTDVVVGNGFFQIAQTANATFGNALMNGGILSLETTDGTATLGGLSGTGTVRGAIQNGAVANQQLTVGGLNLSSTFGGDFQDAFGATLSVVKAGTGTLTLTGASSNAGTTTISAGTLQLGNGGTTGSLGSGNVVDNAVLAFNRSNSPTFSNAISGTGSVSQSGSGTLILSGANTYSGGTTINSGTLLLGSATGVGGGTVKFAGDGTLGTATGISGTANGITVNAGINATIGAAAGQTLALTGSFNQNTAPNTTVHFGSASLTGTVDFGFNSMLLSQAGGAFIDGGTLRLNTSIASIYFLNNGGLTIASGATLDLNSLFGAGVNLSGGGTITNNGGLAAQFQAQQTGTSTFGGTIQDGTSPTSLQVRGGGTLILTGANTYSGATTFSGGSTLQLGNGGTTGSISGGSSIDLTNGHLAIDRSDAFTLANVLSGSGSLIQSGVGTTTVTGANTYSGGTTIKGGTLLLGSAGALGTGPVIFAADGILGTATGISGTANGITVNAGINATMGAAAGQTLALTGSFNQNTAPNTTVHFGSASLTGIVDFGFNSMLLSQAGGAFIDGGTLRLNTSIASIYFLNNGGLTIASGATLDINGQYGAGVNLSGGGTITNNGGVAAQFQAQQTGTATFGGTIQDGTSQTSLLVRGGGTLILTGANTYSGATTFSGGSTLQLGNGGATGSIGGGDIDLTNGHLVVDRAGAISLTGTISGTGDLTQAGPGVTTVTGANTYSGATNLNLGTLEVGNTNALGTGTLTFAGAGAATTLRGIATASLANDLHFNNGANASITAAAGTTLTLNGSSMYIDSSAAGTALHFGNAGDTGTVVFNPAFGVVAGGAGYDIFVDGGTLQAGSSNTLPFLTGLNNVNTTVAAGATLDYTPFLSGSIYNLLGAGTVLDDGGTTSVRSGLFSGDIAGTQNLHVYLGGTLILTGANTYSGTTTFAGNGTLQLGDGGTSGSIGGGDIDLSDGHLAVNQAGSVTLANTITGTGDLTQAGTGVTTLTATNTYTGATNLQQGTLQAGSTNAFGTGNLIFAGGGVATTVRGLTTASLGNSLSFSNGADATIAAAAGTTLTLNGTAFNINAVVPGTQIHFGSASDTGTVVFNPSFGVVAGASGYDILVDGGTLRAGSANTLTFMTGLSSVNTTVAAGATLDYTPFGSGRINNLLGAGTILDDGGTTSIVNGVFSGTLAGTQNVTVVAGGNLSLTGANTYSGTTTVSAGSSLQVGTGGTTGSLGTGAVIDNGSLGFNRSDSLTVGNTITGSGSIVKTGAGALNLTGSNTAGNDFTGVVTVDAGKLLVNGNFGDATGNTATLTVNVDGTLGGSGTFLGSATVNGAINPGNSPGTLTIAGNLTLGAGTILNYELGEPGTVGGANNDLVVVGGNLTLDGTLNTLASGAGYGAGYYRLFDYGGTLTDNGLNVGSIAGGYTATVLTNIGGQVNLRLGSSAVQQVQYWDGADTTGASAAVGGDGGTGTWNASNTNWTNPTGYAVNSAWGGQVGVFAGSAGTVTISGTQSFEELRFQTDGYTLNGATPADGLATTGGFSVIDVSSGLLDTINAGISGSGGLTKTGSGRLVLGGANTYTGTTTVAAGRLDIIAGASLAGDVVNNATFTTNGTGTVNGNVTNASTGLLSSFGVINGNLTNSGTASVINQLNGNVANLAGTLSLSSVTGVGAVTQSAGATLSILGPVTIGSLAGAGTVQLALAGSNLSTNADNSSTTFSGTISGSGTLTKVGTGALTLTGTGSEVLTDVFGGTLSLGGTGTLTGDVRNFATLSNAGTIGGFVFNAGSLVSTGVLNGNLSNTVTGTASLSGQLNNALFNSGTVTLTGTTTGITGVTLTGTTAVFDLNGFDTTVGNISGAGSVQLGSATLTTNGDNSSTTLAAVISGSGGLTKLGTGTLTLSGVNTFTGATTVSDGTLVVDTGAALAGAVNNNASFTNAGTVAGLVTNTGTLASTGVLNGGLANSGTSSLSGQLNGALTNSGTVTLTGVTTGIGAVTQSTGATLDLAGFDTTVGSLAGAGAVQLGSATLTAGGDGTSTAFAGTVAGTGGLTKAGAGTLTLTGANSYTGLTTVSGGTLALGAGGTTGSIGAGAIVDNGIVAINRSDTVTLANAISGTGSLQQNGAGTTTLTGANTYSGGTTVNAGRLVGNTGSLQGDIADNAAVEFAQATAGTYSGSLSGAGMLNKTGAGRLALTGNSAGFTGATRVLAGELAVNGSLAGSAVTVGTGATLSGTGPIGGLVVQSGGTVAPGNGVGTLTVGGNVALQAASTFAAEIAAAGADRIQAGGTAQLAGNLALTNLGRTYTMGASYVLLDATGGRSGTFATATGLNSFGNQFRAKLVYTPTQVDLVLAPNILAPLAGSALTPNQSNFINAFDAAVLGGLNTQPFDALFALSGSTLASATDQLSGGIYPTMTRTTLEDERLVREAVLDRAASSVERHDTGYGLWASGFGSWGDGDSDGNAAAFDRNTKGVAIGADGGGQFGTNGEYRVGVFAHYLETHLRVDALNSRATIKRTGGGGYFGVSFGPLNASMGLSLSNLNTDVTRSIAFAGFAGSAESHPTGHSSQAFGEVGYRLPVGATTFVEPFAAASIANVRLHYAPETGSSQRLDVANHKNDLGTLDFGLRADTAIGGFRLGGRAAARHWFGDRTIATSAVLDLAPQEPFLVSAAPVDKWGFVGKVDASFQTGPVTASIGYSGVFTSSAKDQGVTGTVSVRF